MGFYKEGSVMIYLSADRLILSMRDLSILSFNLLLASDSSGNILA